MHDSKVFKEVEVAHRTLLVSFTTLDVFFQWMAERDRIRRKRSAGGPQPWSKDPTFQTYKFCHVFRIFDRGSQFLLHNVIEEGSQEHQEICFRVILFKLFNRISTWNALQQELGPLTWASFDLEAYERVLARVAQDNRIYTGAYQIPPPDLVGGPGFKNHLVLLHMMMMDDIPGKILSCENMEDAYELIKYYPGMGQFLSYQMVLDLNMTPHINYPENTWAVCGPGSQACLEKIFGRDVRGIETEAIGYLYQTQEEHFSRLGITDPPELLEGRPEVSYIDIEHSLCECSKYLKLRDQDQAGTWKASDDPVTHDLPTKWVETLFEGRAPEVLAEPLAASSPPACLALTQEDTYEVSHIVGERRMRSGGLRYRIRWIGYGPEEDFWMSEEDLKDAPDVLRKWRTRRLAQDEINGRVAKIRSSHRAVGKIGQSPVHKLRLHKTA